MERRTMLAASIAISMASVRPVRAADAVRLIVAYTAGGAADVVARRLQTHMRMQPPAAFVVENLPGAGGGLGVRRALMPSVDGVRWLVGTLSETVVAPLLNPSLGYRPEHLQLVGIAAGAPMVLVGRAGLAQPSLAPLLEAARLPGAADLSIGNFGHGSISHLMALELGQRASVRLLHVPHAGMAPLLRELVAGRVDLAFVPMAASVAEWAAHGRLRLYALTAGSRDPRFPELPTADEALGLSGWRQSLWVGIFLSADASVAQWDRAAAALAVAQNDVEFQRVQRSESSEPGLPMTREHAQALYAQEIAHHRRMLTEVAAPAR